ncbi:MAG TPA: hypothetical protein VNM24_12540 [Burkholderiales bacterium]|jgi:hypothetical protein|nr:hypothetical protein [Burkholderiales bacterium]
MVSPDLNTRSIKRERLPPATRGLLTMCLIAAGLNLSGAAPPDCVAASRQQADAALAQAKAAVARAAEARALWLNAQEALLAAEAALQKGDFAQTCREAFNARDFAELGITQLGYPPYRH